MKNLIILFIISTLLVFTNCKRDKGYNCENGECKAADKDAKYLTLSDCKSDCADTRLGGINLTVGWTEQNYGGNRCWKVEAFLALTSSDLDNGAFLFKQELSTSPANFIKDNLKPGNYYYRVTRTPSTIYTNCGPNGFETGVLIVNPGGVATAYVGI